MPEKSWFFAMNEKDLSEGKIEFSRVKGTPVLLTKKEGTIYSLYGKCLHKGCRLSKGTFSDAYILKCGCHGWEYDIRTGKHLGDDSTTLETYENKVEDGEIFVLL
ncbi:Rieske (2Fe-2S) protein [Methanolobus sp. ZRKC2]|uniref:Rieske (2Fe-2S) protein n=1 Tax=unclassified Methanolobus TaxID=2629569 RepID=UPI00324FE09D